MNALIVAAGGSASDTRFYNSAWGTSSSDIVEFGNSNNGLPSASAALSLFSGFATLEIDYAANWGIGAWTGSGISSSDVVNGKVTYSPYAEIMRLMAESLVGTLQVETPTMNGSRDDDVLAFAFEDDANAVIFLSANDFVGHELVTLDGFGEIGYVWAERISSSGDAVSGFETEVSREVLTANGLDILVHFDKPFEIVRLIVGREDPGFGELHLWGDETADTLRGGMSGDFLEGNGGADHISGRDGNDTIHGGSGNDVLYGNDGNDFMSGGPGEDRIVGGLGVDTLSYLDANSGVSIWIDDQNTESPEGDDTFSMIERYLGSDFGDAIRDFGTNAIEIDSRAGDDTVLISNATGVVTQLGDGDDSYIDYGVGNTVSGGEGDDTFLVFGDAANVFGGLGDDEIVLGSGSYNVHFSHGGGNDRIRGFTPDTDHLHLEEALFEIASSGTAEVVERDGAWGISFGHDTAIWFPDLLAADLIGILEDVSLF
ncbi:MAG TPA: calcium-binding protein [Rhodobacterales bacterium]|nr:calcium-binding protein [Rhodobacterales bacterium]